jgi:hypothetical protein
MVDRRAEAAPRVTQDDQHPTLNVGTSGDQTGSNTTMADPADPAASVMRLLAEGVPLTLLADLAAPDGPASQVILETEGLPDDAWWETDSGVEQASDELLPDP